MDDIGIGQAILMALLIYGGLSLLFTTLGSFGLYKLLSARKNPSATWIAVGTAILILAATFFGALQFSGTILVALLCYAVFGITAWALNKSKV